MLRPGSRARTPYWLPTGASGFPKRASAGGLRRTHGDERGNRAGSGAGGSRDAGGRTCQSPPWPRCPGIRSTISAGSSPASWEFRRRSTCSADACPRRPGNSPGAGAGSPTWPSTTASVTWRPSPGRSGGNSGRPPARSAGARASGFSAGWVRTRPRTRRRSRQCPARRRGPRGRNRLAGLRGGLPGRALPGAPAGWLVRPHRR
jgi:hypothetical protein